MRKLTWTMVTLGACSFLLQGEVRAADSAVPAKSRQIAQAQPGTAAPAAAPATAPAPAAPQKPKQSVAAAKASGARKGAPGMQKTNIDKLSADLDAIKPKAAVTPEQKKVVSADLMALVRNPVKPSQESIDKLANNLTKAKSGGNLSKPDQTKIIGDISKILNANGAVGDLDTASKNVEIALAASGAAKEDAAAVGNDLKALGAQAQKNLTPKKAAAKSGKQAAKAGAPASPAAKPATAAPALSSPAPVVKTAPAAAAPAPAAAAPAPAVPAPAQK